MSSAAVAHPAAFTERVSTAPVRRTALRSAAPKSLVNHPG